MGTTGAVPRRRSVVRSNGTPGRKSVSGPRGQSPGRRKTGTASRKPKKPNSNQSLNGRSEHTTSSVGSRRMRDSAPSQPSGARSEHATSSVGSPKLRRPASRNSFVGGRRKVSNENLSHSEHDMKSSRSDPSIRKRLESKGKSLLSNISLRGSTANANFDTGPPGPRIA